MTQPKRILVIKLSAFGDFIISLGLFERIRAAHPHAHITLMTTHPFKDLGEQTGYFDEVRTIARWRATTLGPWLRYIKTVWRQPYQLVYDLQMNDRTRVLRLLSPAVMRQHWADFARKIKGAVDIAVFAGVPPTQLDWLVNTGRPFSVPAPYVLLVPGSAPQHPAKRWPATHYAQLAKLLLAQGVTPVLLGTAAEADITTTIAQQAPGCVNLTGQTSFADIARLAQNAEAAVGNDTGPMHLISCAGCPVVSLFSHASDPAQSAPRGKVVRVLRSHNLTDVAITAVYAETQKLLG